MHRRTATKNWSRGLKVREENGENGKQNLDTIPSRRTPVWYSCFQNRGFLSLENTPLLEEEETSRVENPRMDFRPDPVDARLFMTILREGAVLDPSMGSSSFANARTALSCCIPKLVFSLTKQAFTRVPRIGRELKTSTAALA